MFFGECSVLARMSVWQFKEGKSEVGFLELDRIFNTVTRHTEGFRGYLSLLTYKNPNAATVLTLWQDENALNASEQKVYADAIRKVQNLLENLPVTSHFRVFSTELFQCSSPLTSSL